MNRLLICAGLLALAAPAGLAAPGEPELASTDVKGLVAGLRREAKQDKTKVQEVRAAYRAERDCVNFSFEPQGPAVSEAVWLRSTEYREECTPHGDPRNGGGTHCREVPAWTHRERVQVELRERKELRPWEREVFQVCLEGSWLSIHPIRAGHKYAADRRGGYYTLTAGARIPMAPDPRGVRAQAPRNTGASLAVDFADQWASYYAGEKLALKVTLKRDVEGWFDSTLVTKELSFDTAERYAVDFGAFAAEFSSALKPGKKYYVEYGFRRLGSVSTDAFVKAGESERTAYQPRLTHQGLVSLR